MDDKSIFNKARKIPDLEVRDEYLRMACGDDVEVIGRIKILLEAATDESSFLKNPALDSLETEVFKLESSRVDQRIGPYKILQEIGEGGMGAVYMAEQEKPVRRRVALKIIKTGMADKQLIARFEAERQALAMMDHPNIAKVLDAGQADDGSPYLVMELIQGIPITKYCDHNKLTPIDRLKLFVPICKAIQHAHQKGILHRDLKPGNVLVCIQDGKPVPKVIDFGLAKPLQHQIKLTDKTMFTEFGQVLGTVQYMSPEQAVLDALDIDTRSDIYSLGIMLYELLSGSTPVDQKTLRQNALLKVLEIIRESDPPRPSLRLASSKEQLTTISQQRQIQPAKLEQILRDELDWVVMKALEKDRTRRYESANDFAEDINRYLNGDAVVARPPTLFYRSSKYVRKHRAFFATVTAIALLSIIGIAGMLWQKAESYRLRVVERVESTIDSLATGRGPVIPVILKQLDFLPSKYVLSALEKRFGDATRKQKLNLAYGLAYFDQVEIQTIIEGLVDKETEPEEIVNIVAALRNDVSQSLERIKTIGDETTKNKNWIVKVRLAIVSLHLGNVSLAAEMLRDGPLKPGDSYDPAQRTFFIREFNELSGPVESLAEILKNTDNPALRSGMCLALGGVKKTSSAAKIKWQPVLEGWHISAKDKGTHSASGWALSKLKLEIPNIPETKNEPSNREWWHAFDGLTLVKIVPGTVTGEVGPILIDDDYWLSDSEVTVGLFKKFMTDKEYHNANPDLKPVWGGEHVFDDNEPSGLPVHQVSWVDTLLFCNWLSAKLDLDPCYRIIKSKDTNDYDVSWTQDANGIRLPTEQEWEYACRAATTTRFSFGDHDNDLLNYGWFGGNSDSRSHPVRTTLCNAWGLFDMHGNVWEWCWDGAQNSKQVIRGGAWSFSPFDCRASFRAILDPSVSNEYLGFRVAQGPVSQAKE